MSIRSAIVVLGVCAGACVHGSPVFTAGDIFWVSKKPMKMFEVTGGGNFAAAVPQTVFTNTWESLGNLVFAEDGSVGYLTATTANGSLGALVKLNPDGTQSTLLNPTSPSALALLGDTIYFTNTPGTLSKVVNGVATSVLSGLGTPRAMVAYNGGLLITEQSGGRIRQVTFNGSTAVSTNLYSGLVQPVDLAILGGYLYYSSVVKSTLNETITKVVKIDLATGVKTDHAWGQKFYGLTVAGGRLLSSNYKEGTSSIWDITNYGDYSAASPWATGLQGFGDLMFATVPGTPPAPPTGPGPEPPAETPEVSAMLLVATGLAMIGARAIRI